MTHAAIINLWPSLSEFADDLGVPYGTAKAMRRRRDGRGSIPDGYWIRLVEAAGERGIAGVTLEALAAAAAREMETVSSSPSQDAAPGVDRHRNPQTDSFAGERP